MEPLLFNEDNHLIGTRTGDGSHSTNQQPNTSSRRASPSPSTYPVQGYAKNTDTLLGLQCTTENTQRKQTRPLKDETTIDENTANHFTNKSIPKRAGSTSTRTPKEIYVYGLYPKL